VRCNGCAVVLERIRIRWCSEACRGLHECCQYCGAVLVQDSPRPRTRWCSARCRRLGTSELSNRRRRSLLRVSEAAYEALVVEADRRELSLGALIGEMLERARRLRELAK